MGNAIKKFLKRIFDYPVKRKPICFFRSEDFTTTGKKTRDPIPKETEEERSQLTEYDKLVQSFYSRLAQEREKEMENQEKDVRSSFEKLADKFAGWDEVTVSNLHNLFLLFDDNLNGMLNYENLSSILECLGDTHSNEEKKQKFDDADTDGDGWIGYEEYLNLIYNFDAASSEGLEGLGKLAIERAENVQFVNSLSVGEQLEYGLF